MSPAPPRKKLAGRRRTVFLMAIASIALVAILCAIAVLSGPGSSLHHKSGPAGASSSLTLTSQEYAFARDLVRSEIRRERAVVTSATVTVGYGRVIDSNIGYPCTSGRLLHIKLIGAFPHIVIGGHPVAPSAPLPDFAVHAVNLTADAETGRACLIGVQTSRAAPLTGAVSLPVD